MLLSVPRAFAVLLLVATACRGGDERAPAEEAGKRPSEAPAPEPADAAPAAAPGDGAAADGAAGPRYPATTDGLRELVGDILRAAGRGDRAGAYALADGLRLPDPAGYFSRLFGEELGNQLAADYAETAERIRELVPLLRELVKRGQTEIRVDAFDRPSDRAVGYQSRALERMIEPTALFSVRFVAPGEQRGFHLWSFVHDGDRFRWAGKMQRVAADGEAPAATWDLPEDAEISLDGDVPDPLELPAGADVRGGE